MSRVTKLSLALATFALLGFAGATPVKADFVTFAQPTPAYTGATTNIAITQADFTNINSLSDGTMTVGFSSAMNTRTVPGSWATWGLPPFTESATPRILYSNGATALTLTLSLGTNIFGFELEPNLFAPPENISVDFFDGVTLVGNITQSVSGTSGARLFAAMTTTNLFTRVVITDLSQSDFAIAQLRYGSGGGPGTVPEPATMLLLGTGLAGVAAKVRQRRKAIKRDEA